MLSGTVDMEEAFFGAAHEGSKRGRGTDKTAVVFGLSFDGKGFPSYLRARILDTVNGEAVSQFTKDCVEPDSMVRSDGLEGTPELFVSTIYSLVVASRTTLTKELMVSVWVAAIGVVDTKNLSRYRVRLLSGRVYGTT